MTKTSLVLSGCLLASLAGMSGCATASTPSARTIFKSQSIDQDKLLTSVMQQFSELEYTCKNDTPLKTGDERFVHCDHPRRLKMQIQIRMEPTRLIHTSGFTAKAGITCAQLQSKLMKLNSGYNVGIAWCANDGDSGNGFVLMQSSILLPKAGFEAGELSDYFKWWTPAVWEALTGSGIKDDLE